MYADARVLNLNCTDLQHTAFLRMLTTSRRDGEETIMSSAARNFSLALMNELAEHHGPQYRVSMWDERFTSVEAEARLSRYRGNHALDAVAACLILEHYFEDDAVGAEPVVASSDTPAYVAPAAVQQLSSSQRFEQMAMLKKDAMLRAAEAAKLKKVKPKKQAKKRQRGETIL
jgi:Holliday junction resolvase